MGNCCGGGEEDAVSQHNNRPVQAFQGQGHRLGSANDEVTPLSAKTTSKQEEEEANAQLPEPRHDPNVTDEEREKQRRARVAAAEARLKKAGGPPKKKKEYKDTPLTGPNSKPAMSWTVG